MAQLVPLKCTSCGAPVSRESSRCEFCGTEFALVQDGSGLQTKQVTACVGCKNPLGSGAWLCPKCGTPVAGNEERLKELHAKQQYLQEDARKTGFEAGGIIGADEYVYFLFGIMRGFYAVTEKRLLKYLHPRFGEPRLTEFTWSEVAAATLVTQRDMGGVRYELQIQTLKGRVDLHFSVRDGQFAYRFQREVANALNKHNMGQRDVRALIWSYHPS